MANPYAKIITDVKLETEGSWVELDQIDSRAKITRIGGVRNTEYFKEMSDLVKQVEDMEELTPEEDQDLMVKLYSRVLIKDWEVKNPKGKFVRGIYMLNEDESDVTIEEPTVDNIYSIITRFPEIRVVLIMAARDIATFQTKKVEEIAKN